MATDIGFGILGPGTWAGLRRRPTRQVTAAGSSPSPWARAPRAWRPNTASPSSRPPGAPGPPGRRRRRDRDAALRRICAGDPTAAAGKHVYLEKPMALNVAECDAIIAACRAAGVQLTVAKQTRHMEMSMRAKEYLDEGLIGELIYIRPMSVTPGAGFANVPQTLAIDPSEGDAFLDWGSHACDAIRWFSGADAVRVYADMDNYTGLPTRIRPRRCSSGSQSRHRADPALLRDRAVRLRHAPQQPVPARRHARAPSSGTSTASSSDRQPRRASLGAGRAGRCRTSSRATRAGSATRPARSNGLIVSLRDGTPLRITGEDGRAAIEMSQAANLSPDHKAVDLPLIQPAIAGGRPGAHRPRRSLRTRHDDRASRVLCGDLPLLAAARSVDRVRRRAFVRDRQADGQRRRLGLGRDVSAAGRDLDHRGRRPAAHRPPGLGRARAQDRRRPDGAARVRQLGDLDRHRRPAGTPAGRADLRPLRRRAPREVRAYAAIEGYIEGVDPADRGRPRSKRWRRRATPRSRCGSAAIPLAKEQPLYEQVRRDLPASVDLWPTATAATRCARRSRPARSSTSSASSGSRSRSTSGTATSATRR